MNIKNPDYKFQNLEQNKISIIEEFNQIKNNILELEKKIEFMKKKLEELDSKINGNYEAMEYINSGGSALVYKLLNKISKKYIAAKIILKDNYEKNIINEIIISKKVKNKYIINYYSWTKKDELYFIFMEYANFGSLIDFQHKIIKRNYLSESFLCFISYQILKGLKYLHTIKIVHFDVKPQNILINEYLDIKITDFSISKDYSKINSKEIKLDKRGTGYYMAPEVIQEKTININDLNKVDLYSFGVTLYKLAFGCNPFGIKNNDIKNDDLLLDKILNGPILENEDNYFSECFIDFIKRLLEPDINNRININEALNHYWILGSEILYNEKEKMFNATNFLSYLISDHFKNFDDFIKGKI